MNASRGNRNPPGYRIELASIELDSGNCTFRWVCGNQRNAEEFTSGMDCKRDAWRDYDARQAESLEDQVARELAAVDGWAWDTTSMDPDWYGGRHPDSIRDDYRKSARAAIAIVRANPEG